MLSFNSTLATVLSGISIPEGVEMSRLLTSSTFFLWFPSKRTTKSNFFSPSNTEPVACPAKAVLTILFTSLTLSPNCDMASRL